MKQISESSYPAQLRHENKKLVEAQNFSIKQPQLSGDVFDAINYREKSRPLNGPISALDTIMEDENHKSPD